MPGRGRGWVCSGRTLWPTTPGFRTERAPPAQAASGANANRAFTSAARRSACSCVRGCTPPTSAFAAWAALFAPPAAVTAPTTLVGPSRKAGMMASARQGNNATAKQGTGKQRPRKESWTTHHLRNCGIGESVQNRRSCGKSRCSSRTTRLIRKLPSGTPCNPGCVELIE